MILRDATATERDAAEDAWSRAMLPQYREVDTPRGRETFVAMGAQQRKDHDARCDRRSCVCPRRWAPHVVAPDLIRKALELAVTARMGSMSVTVVTTERATDVALGSVVWLPDPLTLCFVHVLGEARRRGLATRLIGRVLELGRPRLAFYNEPGGAALAAAMRRLDERRRTGQPDPARCSV